MNEIWAHFFTTEGLVENLAFFQFFQNVFRGEKESPVHLLVIFIQPSYTVNRDPIHFQIRHSILMKEKLASLIEHSKG